MAQGGRGADGRLDALQARKLLSRVILHGTFAFSRHARDEMEEDDLTEPDVVNILRCGTVQDGELVNWTWRYRVETQRMCAVVAFSGRDEATVVTVWRVKERGR